MEAALAADEAMGRDADPIRAQLAQRDPAPYPGPEGKFSEFEAWAGDQVTHACSKGGGIKAADEWTGRDLDGYLIDLVENCLPHAPVPHSSGKTRGQAQNLVSTVGGELARRLVSHCVENWQSISESLEIETAYAPSSGIILGYLETLKASMAGKPIGRKKKPTRKTGANRVATKAEYDAEPDAGWG
jgi:hypothetical protein